MGVSGLWTLLEPVGKRVNIQALAGKTLAIDASIWIFQFLNSMRDDEGNFIRNGHLMGFFRRICRLLFNRIRPVFVFDGATPALKRLTVAARRRRRELQAAKVRKTAEKLLLKKLKAHLLEEEKAARAATKARKAAAAAQKKAEREAGKASKPARKRKRKEDTAAALVDDLTASTQGTKSDEVSRQLVSQADTTVPSGTLQSGSARDQNSIPQGAGTSAATLQQAPDAELLISEEVAAAAQAAEIAAAAVALEDDVEVEVAAHDDRSEEDSDGELDLDAIISAGGELDPAAVGQLPPSLQLEVLTKHREQQAALNRARFQEASKNAEGFSALQMTSYIKQTELRRKMEAVRASSARSRSATAKSHFVLEDHAQGTWRVDEPTQVKVQVHSAGKGPSEWNRHVMNAAKKSPYGNQGGFAPPASLAGILPGMPQLVEQPRTSAAAEQGGASMQTGPESGVPPDAHADTSHVTAEELAAVLGDVGDLGGGADTEDGEDDGIEWEDADVATEADADPVAGAAEAAGPAQPQRRDVWSRTHGYKFGRKLGDWSEGGDDAAPATDASPAVDPVEAAVLGAAADVLAEDVVAEGTVQEQRSLQHGILNSLGVREPEIDAAVHAEAAGTERDAAGAAVVAATDASGAERDTRAHVDQGGLGKHGRGGIATDREDREDGAMVCEDVMPLADSVTTVRDQALQHEGVGRRLPHVAEQPGDGDGSVEGRGIGGEARSSGTGVSPGGETASVAARTPVRGGLKMPRWGGGRGAAGSAPRRSLGQPVGTRVAVDAVTRPPEGAATGGCSPRTGDTTTGDHGARRPATAQPAATCMLAIVPSAPPQIANGAVICTDALDGAPARGAGADVPGSTFGGLADGCGSADGDAVSPGSPAMLSSPGRRIAEADPAQSGQAEAVPSSEARGSGAGTSGMASGALGEEYEEFTADEDSADEDDIADEDIAAAVSAAEMDAEVRAAAVDSEAVVMLAEEADTGAGAEAELEGLGGSMLMAGRSSSGPVAKAAAGTLDAFLPQSDATDLERRLRDVMGDVRNAKKNFKKQSGTDDVPTEMMFKECQEMLQLFGIPYIIAPTEAEAQCAWLEEQGLVDGVVTDDNDALLFGAAHVYRHFFKDKQYCEQYLRTDWERDLGLTKEKLALLALLLGSDYTEGISGIGVVNAMETLAAFPSYEELKVFKDWLDSPDLDTFRTVTGRKGHTVAGTAVTAPGPDDQGSVQDSYKASHRQTCKVWEVPASFPDHKVLDAYACPAVDTSKTAFTFLKPDLEILRGYCHRAFGWSQDSTDSLVVPVLQEYEKRQSQLRLDAFYTMTHRFAKIKSKRLQAAVSTAMGRAVPEEMVLSESVVANAAAEAGRPSEPGTISDHDPATDKHASESQEEQAADAGEPRNRKRRHLARSTAARGRAHARNTDYDSESDGDYMGNVMQGFFY